MVPIGAKQMGRFGEPSIKQGPWLVAYGLQDDQKDVLDRKGSDLSTMTPGGPRTARAIGSMVFRAGEENIE